MSFLMETAQMLLRSVPLTVGLALAGGAAGAALAVPTAFALGSGRVWLRGVASAYVGLMRGTPALVQLYLIYYGLPQFAFVREGIAWPVLREPFACAVIMLTLNHAAYLAAILAGAIAAVPRGQVEAARAFGLSGWAVHRRVIAPHAFALAWPAWGNEAVSLLKMTSLCSTITLVELTGTAAIVASDTFRPFAAFALAALLYLALTSILTALWSLVERRQSHIRELTP